MSTVALLDEETRPKAPKIEGVTPIQEMQGRRLAMIHAMHLRDLSEVRRIMDLIEAGEQKLAELNSAVSNMKMIESYRLFGNLCGRECQVLNFHHTIEDQNIFPALRRKGSEGLRKVVDRLAEEHGIIHQLLEELQARAVEAIQQPGSKSFAELKATFVMLDRIVRSHFRYEETELQQALGYHGVHV